MTPIYLDYNASVPLKPAVIKVMTEALGQIGNASSVHSFGRDARSIIELAREAVASLVHTRADQVIFTSGATESNNMVFNHFKGQTCFISDIEHPAVDKAAGNAAHIPVNDQGIVDLEKLESFLQNTPEPALVSIMAANNETGVIQPIKKAAEITHKYGALFHTDAVQAAGKIYLDFDDIGADFMSLSAHKIGGPQGVGALIVKPDIKIKSLLKGGGHEKGCRAGTENVAGIAGFGKAAELALKDINRFHDLELLRDDMEQRLSLAIPSLKIFSKNAPRIVNTSSISLPGFSAESQMIQMDLKGIAISAGSACSSGTVKVSRVLKALGASDEEASSGLRISMGWGTTEDDVNQFVDFYIKMADKHSK